MEYFISDAIPAVTFKTYRHMSRKDFTNSYDQRSIFVAIFVTDEPIPTLLEIASIVISGGSSVGYLAVISGIPLAIPGNCSGLTQSPIPYSGMSGQYSVYYTAEELQNFLVKCFKKRSPRKLQVPEALLRPTEESTQRFFFS